MNHLMMPLENNFPFPTKNAMTVFQCVRENVVCNVRKFKANCGNILEVKVNSRTNRIRSISTVYSCPPGCLDCADRVQKIRILLASEK
jgi:hypothetical protein